MSDVAPYDWVAWLSGQDAKVLLIALMEEVEHPTSSTLAQKTVVGWRENAEEALEAEDYTADVDKYLEVRVDARLFLMRLSGTPYNPGEPTDAEDLSRP